MIVFGTGARTVGEVQVPELRCQGCGEAQLRMTGVVRHFHLFWIPVIPIARVVLTRCTSCGQELADEHVPGPVLARMRSELFTGWRMARSFLGVLVFGLIAIWAIGHGKELDRLTDVYLAQPEPGDVYVVKYPQTDDGDEQFELLQVREVTPSAVRFRSGAHLYHSKSAASMAWTRGEESFDSDVRDVTRAELLAQRKQGELVSIERSPRGVEASPL